MTPAERLPVDVLTGFLGSGKTSLIRRLLENGALGETAILVNEFAGFSVDDRLIALAGADVAVVGDRCLCCVADGQFAATIISLLERRGRGDIPAFRRILVETSGIADPTALIATLVNDPLLRQRVRLGRVVTLVDLLNGTATLAESDEALAQLIAADIVVTTKRDLALPHDIAALTGRIRALNPIARILDAADGNPFDLASTPDHRLAGNGGRIFRALPAGTRHDGIAACLLRDENPVDWARFAAWLSLLLHRRGADILRIKGMVEIASDGAPVHVVVQSVRHLVHRPEHLGEGAAKQGVALVVIARGIDPARILRSFRRHVLAADRAALEHQRAEV